MKKLDKENLHKEIDLIQACINRMAHNSFLVKGWAISIVVVGLALVDKKIDPLLIGIIILIPLLSFWWLDAFFLYTEKLYRKLYKWVISERPNENDAEMYDLNPHRFKNLLFQFKNGASTNKIESQRSVAWSSTLRTFYFIPILLISGICTWLHFSQNKGEEPQKVEIVKVVNAKIENPLVSLDSLSLKVNVNCASTKIERKPPLYSTNQAKNKKPKKIEKECL